MPIDLNALTANKATLTIQWGGESMDVVYRPGLITQDRLDKVSGDKATVQFLLDLLVSWDIRQGTKKLSLTEASINKLPFDLVAHMFNELIRGGSDVSPEA